MPDSVRSLTALAMAFVGVVVVTLGLAATLVPASTGSEGEIEASPSAGSDVGDEAEVAQGPHLGGSLTVGGDREGAFVLTDDPDGQTALTGSDGRITFTMAEDSATITQISYDGLEFFPDPGDCTITPGRHHEAAGIGEASLECTGLEDIRDNGTIELTGTVGLPADLLGMTDDLPDIGGSIAVGDETLEMLDAQLDTAPRPAVGGQAHYVMQLIDEEFSIILNFTYDDASERLTLANIMTDGDGVDVPADACAVTLRELGRANPQLAIVEVSISCAEVEVPGLGPVPLEGSVVVGQSGPPLGRGG